MLISIIYYLLGAVILFLLLVMLDPFKAFSTYSIQNIDGGNLVVINPLSNKYSKAILNSKDNRDCIKQWQEFLNCTKLTKVFLVNFKQHMLDSKHPDCLGYHSNDYLPAHIELLYNKRIWVKWDNGWHATADFDDFNIKIHPRLGIKITQCYDCLIYE